MKKLFLHLPKVVINAEHISHIKERENGNYLIIMDDGSNFEIEHTVYSDIMRQFEKCKLIMH